MNDIFNVESDSSSRLDRTQLESVSITRTSRTILSIEFYSNMFLYYVCQCCGTRVALAHFRANWSIIYFIKFQYMHLVFSIQGPIFDFIAITFSIDLFKCQVNPLLMANSTQCLPLSNGHAKVMKNVIHTKCHWSLFLSGLCFIDIFWLCIYLYAKLSIF